MPKTPPPSALADKFMLRLPDGLRDHISEVAKANGRSMNAEIVYRLNTTLQLDTFEPIDEVNTAEEDKALVTLFNRIEPSLRPKILDMLKALAS